MSYDKPFAGLKVIDVSQGVAGPYCAMLLAQYGANVIKVEPPGVGDWARNLGVVYGDQCAYSLPANLGKRAIALDLKQDDGRAILWRLIKDADVFLQGFRPGVIDRLGFGYDAVSEREPRIIYLSVSGFGQMGPLAERPAMDPILQAYTGLTVENRGEDGIPHRTPIIAIDMSTALYAYSAVSTALYARRDEQRGRHIEASLMQAAAGLQVVRLMQSYLEGGAIKPPGAPSGVYQVADGWMTITVVRLHEWLGFCRAVGLDEFAADETLKTTQGRYDQAGEINAALRPLLASQPFAHWSDRLAAERIMHEQLNSYTGFLEQPHVEASGAIAWLHHPHVPGEAADAAGDRRAALRRRQQSRHRAGTGRAQRHHPARARLHGGRDRRSRPPWRGGAGRCAALIRLPHVIEEAGDRLQPVVGRHDTEIGAAHHRIARFRGKLPGEAHTVVVAFDIAGAAEAMAREAFLHTDDHGVDAVPSLALQHWIEIAGALGPGLGNEIATTAAVGLVPRRDVAIDQISQRVHVWLLHLSHPMRCGTTFLQHGAAGRLHRR